MLLMAFCLYLKRRELADFMVGNGSSSMSDGSSNSRKEDSGSSSSNSSSSSSNIDDAPLPSNGNDAVIDLVCQLALIAALFQVDPRGFF